MIIQQNMYSCGKHSRTIALNTWFMMKNMRNVWQAGTLGRQLYPGKAKGFTESYQDALREDHAYFLVDLTPNDIDNDRLRTRIFSGEHPVVYKLT